MLGSTGIKVSRLCFGSLTIGPMQANLSIDQGAKVIAEAMGMGVNFIDTAKLYNTYEYVKKAIKLTNKSDVVISSRSYDYTYEGMQSSVDEALKLLGVDCIDIFGLHEQESQYTLRGHSDAIDYLINAKKWGKIRAISVSTHNVSVVEAICKMPEIDVVHPLMNMKGIGIGDGTVSHMLKAIEKAKEWGKGIYSMKPIGGGNLIPNVRECLKFVIDNHNIDSIAVGMQSINEVIANVSIFEGKEIPPQVEKNLRTTRRKLHIDYWCEGCGKCVQRCTLNALSLVDGKSVVDTEKCRLCGYCASVCPQFCIKVI